MSEIREYTREIVDRTKNFEFEDLFPDTEALGGCPLCKRPVYERSWFYRCKEPPELVRTRRGAKDDDDEEKAAKPTVVDCPFRIWKDKSGRYIDRTTVVELLAHGKTRILDGFTTRQGRTYRGQLTLENGEVVLQGVAGGSEGEEGAGNETPEYEVNEDPLGGCPVCKDGQVVETRATFVCSKARDLLRRLGRDEASLFGLKKRDIPEGADYCTFLFPRTVCKRELTREDATTYIRDGKTPVLTDFISQRGRPFSASLVLKPETGRHGFEFPPRAKKEGDAEATEGGAAPAPRKGRFGKKAPAAADTGERTQPDGAESQGPKAKAPKAKAPKAKAPKTKDATAKAPAAKAAKAPPKPEPVSALGRAAAALAAKGAQQPAKPAPASSKSQAAAAKAKAQAKARAAAARPSAPMPKAPPAKAPMPKPTALRKKGPDGGRRA